MHPDALSVAHQQKKMVQYDIYDAPATLTRLSVLEVLSHTYCQGRVKVERGNKGWIFFNLESIISLQNKFRLFTHHFVQSQDDGRRDTKTNIHPRT